MGFDLYGVSPKTETPEPKVDWEKSSDKEKKAYFEWRESVKGAYFRNNVWWWRPLWDYVCKCCDDILTEEDMKHGSFNDGWLITKRKALLISARLRTLLHEGKVKKYEAEYKKEVSELPDEPCQICNGTGYRHDEIVEGECNACKGTGKRESWMKSYPFDTENVEAFAEFCLNSGGFEIC